MSMVDTTHFQDRASEKMRSSRTHRSVYRRVLCRTTSTHIQSQIFSLGDKVAQYSPHPDTLLLHFI